MATVRNREEMHSYKKGILDLIGLKPDTPFKQIADALPNENQMTLQWHLKVMSKQGLLTRKKDKTGYKYTLNDGAYKKLDREYKNPVKRSVKSKPAPKNAKAQKQASDVIVSAPYVRMNIQGEEKEIPLASAKSIYFKLKEIFGE